MPNAAPPPEPRSWPTGDCDDPDPLTAGPLLKRGGTWRSYAYNDGIHGNASAEAGQLLICKKGGRDASLRCVDPEVLLAECERLGLVEELVHDGDEARVEHQLVATTSGVLFEIEFSEGVRFTPRLVPPGVAFAVPGPDGPSRQLTTQEGDVELLIDDPSDEGNSVSLLLRKETAAEHKATLQEMADAAKRIAGEEAAEEAAREKRRVERREREEARKAAGVKKRKRRRKPDKW